MDLKNIRKKIDSIDSKILSLLNSRMELALRAKREKVHIEDGVREKEVLEKIEKKTLRLIDTNFIKKLFLDIISESKKLQKEDTTLIAFQGEHGAYSELAGKVWDSAFISIPCREFGEVFEGVESNKFDYGIIPIENTLGGIIGQVNDLLIKTPLFIAGALDLPIHHCLLALPGTDHREIRYVYSHYQALAQCRNFIGRNKLEPTSYYDTAGAARWLFEEMPKSTAVIASSLAAELYNLEILKENIEDSTTNKTRFLILSKEENKEVGNKCSILFRTEHKSGTLFSVIKCFAEVNINLTRIESVPARPGSYAFFLDFLGSKNDTKVSESLAKVKELTSDFRLMGCYNEKEIS